jgi:hypothetical protein
MTKPRSQVSGYIGLGVLCWIISLYVYFTGDPTHLLTTSKYSGAPRDPEQVMWLAFLAGAVSFCVALGKWFLEKPKF